MNTTMKTKQVRMNEKRREDGALCSFQKGKKKQNNF